MKTQFKLFFCVLLISGVLTQKLLLSSNDKVEISRGDSFSGNAKSGDKSGPGSSSGGGKVLILGGSGGGVRGSASSSGGTQYATFGEPTAEAEKWSPKPSTFRRSADSRLQSSLDRAPWISGVGLGSQKVVFWSDCFFNACPKGKLTLEVRASCSFTAYLVDEYGNWVQTLGSGSAWNDYSFDFWADCGKYRIKIVLDCPCGCSAYLCYNLFQETTDCFNCPESQTYNPKTCSCECASTCKDCRKPQVWKDIPYCTCGCQYDQKCPDGQYFDRRECRCKCFPTCCQFGGSDCNTC